MTISQQGVSKISSTLSNTSETYNSEMTTSINNFCNKMNEIWCSKAAQTFGRDIKEAVDSINHALANQYLIISETIKSNVINYNNAETEQVQFSTVSLTIPSTDALLNLNSCLRTGPNGDEVGLADGHTISEVKEPFQTISNSFSNAIASLQSMITSANAFDGSEQAALSESLTKIKTKYEGQMQELLSSVDTRAASEDNNRSGMRSQNEANIQTLAS